MILYCWNITYHRKLHLISSSRPNPLGSCGQSSSSRLFAPCYHSLPRFPSLARRLSCPTNVRQDCRTSQKKVKAIGSRDDARKVEYYIPLSWSPRVQTTSSPPFFLRDSRASETRVRVKIIPREKRRHECRLFSRGMIFTRTRVSLVLLSRRENGGPLAVQFQRRLRPLVCTHYLIKKSSLRIKLVYYFKNSEINVSTSFYPVYRSTVNIGMLIYEDNFSRGKD